jgi:hypothetical protein
MNLVAKPIVKDHLWVITDGENKVGNVESGEGGFTLKMGDRVSYFDSTTAITETVPIRFLKPGRTQPSDTPAYARWPVSGRTYNNMYDVRRRLHVYTKTDDSKCYYAAGYYRIQMDGEWQTVFCPKYIFIQRYAYHGPFNTETEADQIAA